MEFTSTDPRLRPQGDIKSEPYSGNMYELTREDFPELHGDVQAMLARVGLQEHTIFILTDDPDTPRDEGTHAGIQTYTNTIIIGSNYINHLTYDEVMAIIGHEVAHEWVSENIKELVLAGENVKTGHEQELQADAIGAAITGNVGAAISALEHNIVLFDMKGNEHHPEPQQRIEALRNNREAIEQNHELLTR